MSRVVSIVAATIIVVISWVFSNIIGHCQSQLDGNVVQHNVVQHNARRDDLTCLCWFIPETIMLHTELNTDNYISLVAVVIHIKGGVMKYFMY